MSTFTLPKHYTGIAGDEFLHFGVGKFEFLQFWYEFKIEKILKGSLDSILSPSPSLKIQVMGGKICLRCKDETLLGDVNKFLKTKSLLTTPNNVLPLHMSQANIPAHNLNVHWRWWDWIRSIFLNLFYFNKVVAHTHKWASKYFSTYTGILVSKI